MPFVLHHIYTRQQIHDSVGGDLQSYLPHIEGTVVCGCFDPNMNTRAPYEIDLGEGPDVYRWAAQLFAQGSVIPVFIRRDNFAWEYVGDFTATKLSQDRHDLHPSKAFRRQDAVAVLYLAEQPVADQVATASALAGVTEANEGSVRLREHRSKERSRILSEAKRRTFRAEHGELRCEACARSTANLPAQLAEACFEVHHLLPLSSRNASSKTSLDDLALLCANCHRMIHRSDPLLSVVDFKALLQSSQVQV